MPFKFKINEAVKMKLSDEVGIVIARSEHLDSKEQYQIRYRAGDGRMVETWWAESALVKTRS